MKYSDFSEYSYCGKEPNTYNIGWLENTRKFNKGRVPDQVLFKLWEYIKCPFREKRGVYWNKTLDMFPQYFKAKYNGYEIPLGDAEIRVIDEENKCVYAAPNLVLHYIMNHHYLPPKEFLNAVMYGPKPNSDKYSEYIMKLYKCEGDIILSKRICPFCKSKKAKMLYRQKKVYKEDKNIKIVPICRKRQLEITDEEYNYFFVCCGCGKIFLGNNEKVLYMDNHA